MTQSGKIFFASDFHLGLHAGIDPVEREKKVVKWLNHVSGEAREIYLLGDIFDFWWEYKRVVPRGFTRFLGAISSITDSGTPVHFFTGNHDMWVGNYLSSECGMIIHESPLTTTFNGKKFHLAHGEGLGTRNYWYKVLLGIFRNKPLRMLYSSLHPRVGVSIGQKWSMNSRFAKGKSPGFMGEDAEDLIRYSKSMLDAKNDIDYFIFGHRHLAFSYSLGNKAMVLFLGDWIHGCSYATWDGLELRLEEYHSP